MTFSTNPPIDVEVSTKLLKRHQNLNALPHLDIKRKTPLHGALLVKNDR